MRYPTIVRNKLSFKGFILLCNYLTFSKALLYVLEKKETNR